MITADYYIGKQVKLIGSHPWSGEIGTVTGVQEAKAIGKMGLIVKLDNGTECFVFNMSQMKII